MRLVGRLLRPRNFTQPPIWQQPERLFSVLDGSRESIGNDFVGYIRDVYRKNGPIFTCLLIRMMVFSEVRFAWRNFDEDGRPSGLFTTPDLEVVNDGQVLAALELDGGAAGNGYAIITDQGLRRLRPDGVTVLTGSPSGNPFDYRARILGYVYDTARLGGVRVDPVTFRPDEMIHYSPLPDGIAQWRGMSWITPVLDEIKGDRATTKHKLKFFENGAVPGLILSYDKGVTPEQIPKYMEVFQETHGGIDNAYRALHMGGGVDPKTIGTNLQQLEFKTTQAAGEARIAAASGLGAVMAQFSEGLTGSSLNEGNFKASKDRSEMVLFRPLWRIAARAIQKVLKRPDGAHLWYDPRDVAFLRDDAKAEAEVHKLNAEALQSLWNSGWEPESAKQALLSGDFSHLTHTGLQPVQAQPVQPKET